MTNNNIQYKQHKLRYWAEYWQNRAVEEEKLKNIDMTEAYFTERDNIVKEGELIDETILGRVRGGKTTVGFALGATTMKSLIKYGYQPSTAKFGLKNIARDQQEKAEMMKKHSTMNTVIVTDEHNDAEDTGENVTVEKSIMYTMSDVHAARYIHSISISPRKITEINSDIILEVISKDKETMTTVCNLYYRYYKAGQETMPQLLGYVIIDVSDIIRTWESKVKKHFYKAHKTQEDKKIIEEYRMKDWYTQYVVLKHQKIDMMTKHQIYVPRKLKYAGVTKQVVEKLKKITALGVVNREVIRNFVKLMSSENKVPQSIVGEELGMKDAKGILDLYKSYYQLSKKIEVLHSKLKKSDSPMAKQKMHDDYEAMKDMRSTLREAIHLQEKELDKLVRLNEQYNQKH